jgi:NADPH oxidase 1
MAHPGFDQPGWIEREFLTLRRVIFNFLWYSSQIAVFCYGWYSQASNVKLAGLNSLMFSVWVSRGAGLVLGLDGFLILLPVLRNTLRMFRPALMVFFPADENIWL